MKKKRKFVFLIIISILFWHGILWLSLFVIFLIVLYFSALKLIGFINHVFLKRVIKSILLYPFIFFIAICIKLLLIDIYKIPSPSMSNTLFTNDFILVNKLKYGPKLPRSPLEIPWVNIAFYFNKKASMNMRTPWWDYKRLSGTTTTKNGDVAVFTTFDKNMVMVKRCIGIAGDTLNIKNGTVFINNVERQYSENIKNMYRFKINDKKSLHEKINSLQINQINSRNKEYPNLMSANLSLADVKKLKKSGAIDSLHLVTKAYNPADELFSNPTDTKWTTDYLGPIIIPKRGMQIILNERNYEIYQTAINRYEKDNKLEYKNKQFIMNGKQVQTYMFEQNYYFMMGDNRNDSYDSRFIGFIPEQNIIGKVQAVLWSNYKNKFQFSRFFKSVK